MKTRRTPTFVATAKIAKKELRSTEKSTSKKTPKGKLSGQASKKTATKNQSTSGGSKKTLKHIALTGTGPTVALEGLPSSTTRSSRSRNVSKWMEKSETSKGGRGKKKVVEDTEEEGEEGGSGDEVLTPSRSWQYYDVNFDLDTDSGSSLYTEDWTPSECDSFRVKMRERRRKNMVEKGGSLQPTRVLPKRGGNSRNTYKKKRRGRVYDW